MTRAWKNFLLIRLPLALLAIGVVCQLVAASLSQLPMRRNRIDEFALADLNDHQPHRVVLLGDSIIRDATLQYAAGSSADVLNLTTQGFVGLPGDLFLLQRYLRSHNPPQHVVIAAAPDDYAVTFDPRMIHYYMWNTFSDASERAFLKSHVPTIDARESYPAVLDLQERIVERLFTLTKRGPARFDQPPPLPDPAAPVEPASDNQADAESTQRRLDGHDLSLAPIYRDSVAEMCRLGRQYGFVLNVVWAPMPPAVAEGRKKSGQLAALDRQLQDVFASIGCQTGPIFNMNDVQTFTNFDSGAFHLRGSGWQERAAAILHEYLQSLPGVPQRRPSLLHANGPASADAVTHTGL
jgi:hypothetical protein